MTTPTLAASAPPPLSLVALPAGLLLVGVFCEFRVMPDADVTWLLTVARQMSHGARLYSRDIVEINPPLVMYLGQAAMQAGQLAGLDAVAAWRLAVLACLSIACVLALPMLTRLAGPEGRASAAPMSVLFAAVIACLPGSSFGQREHLIVIWLAPYVLCAALRVRGAAVGRLTGSLVGVALACAVAIKPHYLVVVALVELGLLVARRRLDDVMRPEVVVAALCGTALGVFTLVNHPTYVSAGLRLATEYYPDYGAGGVVWGRLMYLAMPVAVLAFAESRGVSSPLCRMCTLAAVGCGIASVAQGKGWSYQFLPMQSFLVLATGAGCLAVADAALPRVLPSPRSRTRAFVAVAVVLVLVVGGLAERRTRRIIAGPRQRTASALLSMLERAQPATSPRSLSGLTLDLFPAFPVSELFHADWASRFSCLWTIPAIEARERAGGAGATPERSGRADLEAAVVADLVERRPTFVIVEEHRSRVLDEIVALPGAQAALCAYDRIGTVDTFQVWKRR